MESTGTAILACALALVPAAQAQQSRIVEPIDVTQAVVLHTTVNPLALAQKGDEGAVDPSLKLPWMTLWFARTPAQEAALASLLADRQDPSSPNYHKWLRPAEYADRFGLIVIRP